MKKISIREPSKGWARLNLKELWEYRELLYILAWRDISVRYKQTLMGGLWAIIQPFVTMVIFTLFFNKIAKIPSDNIPYPIFSYTALVPWTFFVNGLNKASVSLVSNNHLINKVYLPRLVLPISAVLVGSVDFAMAFLVLILLMLCYGVIPTMAILYLPFFILLILITSLGVGIWIATLNVRYYDIHNALPFLVQAWMFATPIAYPSSLIVTLLVNACILHYRWINSDHFFAIMNTAEKRKDWQTIIPYGHKAVQLNPYRKKYNASLGLAYLKTGNTKQAIQEFNQVLQHYPYHTNALFNLGVACFQENLHDQALSTFKQYQRIRPNYHNLHYNLGHIYLHQKKYDHASKAFQKALHLKPGWKEATHYLDIAQKTLQDSKANAMKFQNIAIQFMKKKQYQKAIQAYDKAITFAPNDAALHFNKGSAYIEVQQYQSAKAAFKKAIACQPDWALAYKFLGVVLYEYLNEKQRAIGYLEKALQYDPMIKEYQKIQKVIDSDGR